MEWGPSKTLSPNIEVQKEVGSHYKTTGKRTSDVEAPVKDGRSASPKIWMQTFLPKVERVTSGGYIYSRYPNRSLFPNDVVVSFRIYDQESQFSDLVSLGDTATGNQTNPSMPIVGCTTNRSDTELSSSVMSLAVTKTVSWGIQWLYSVKLDEKLDTGPFEWTDFRFSDRFLICLSTSGTISLYGAMEGLSTWQQEGDILEENRL
ncbi:hypothetical protein AAHA92_02700 [Salvia divinorum]|uniref:Uncharacterized protein n=1 Tax=Salvia divinorum TaxID=28513 RepID=A0ABD1IEP9_SALDI